MAQNNISLGLSMAWTPTGGPSYATESQTLFTAMDTAGAPADTTRKGLIDTCIRALITAGVWSKLDVLQMYASHASAAAPLNWKAPGVSRTAVLVGAVTFTADRGYTTNGTNNYVDTNFNPGGGDVYAQNSAHFGIWTRTTTQFGSTPCGFVSANGGTSVNPRGTSDFVVARINTTNGTIQTTASGVTNASGHTFVNRSGALATDTQVYKNGSALSLSSQVGASQAPLNGGFRVGNSNLAYGAGEWSIHHSGSSLTAQNATDLYTALATYMTAIGA